MSAPPMDPRGAAKFDRIAELIIRGLNRPNPILPGIVRVDLGATHLSGGVDMQYVSVEVGNTWVRAAWLPANAVVVDKCCFVTRTSNKPGAQWVVLATNYQVPVPPPIMVGWYELIDVDPGPDGIQGTGDDDPLGEGEGLMLDEDGRVLVEYA